MYKKLLSFIFAVFLIINISGCLVAMIWMSENLKVKQTLNVSYSQAIDIVKGSMIEQGIKFHEATIEKNISRINAEYHDGKSVHIFIHEISSLQCTIAVRVGTSETEKKIAEEILKNIIEYSKRK